MSDCDYVYLKGKRIARSLVVLRDAEGREYVLPPHDDQKRTGLDMYGRTYVSAAQAGERGLRVGIIVSDHKEGGPDHASVVWDACGFDAKSVYGRAGREFADKSSKNGTLFDDVKFNDQVYQVPGAEHHRRFIRDLILSRFLEGVSYGEPTKGSIGTVLGCFENISREKIYDMLAFSDAYNAEEGGQIGNVLSALAGVNAHPEYQERLEAYLQSEPVLAYCMHYALAAYPATLKLSRVGESSSDFDKRLESLEKLENILERATQGEVNIMRLATDCVEMQDWSTWTIAALGRAKVDPETWKDLSGFSAKVLGHYGRHVTNPFSLMARTGIPVQMWEGVAFEDVRGRIFDRSRVPAVAVAAKMAELFPGDSNVQRIQPSVLTALSLLHATIKEVDEEYEHGEKSATVSYLSTDLERYGEVTGYGSNNPSWWMPGIDLTALLREEDPEQAALLAIGKTLADKELSEQPARDALIEKLEEDFGPIKWAEPAPTDDRALVDVLVYPFESLSGSGRARELSAAETRAELGRFVEFDANGKPVRFLTREEQEAKKSVGYEDREVYEYTDTDAALLRHTVVIRDTVSAVEKVLTNEKNTRVDRLWPRDAGIYSIEPDVLTEDIIAELDAMYVRGEFAGISAQVPPHWRNKRGAEDYSNLLRRAYDRASAIPALCLAQIAPKDLDRHSIEFGHVSDSEIVSRLNDVPFDYASGKKLVLAMREYSQRYSTEYPVSSYKTRVIGFVNDKFGKGFFAETIAGHHYATPAELAVIVKEAETAETLRRVLANPFANAKVRKKARERLDDWVDTPSASSSHLRLGEKETRSLWRK